MLQNKKFSKYAILFMILGIVYMFMYSGLQNDHINIIKTFSAWDSNKTMSPLTAGNFACIVLTFIYGTFFIKFGVRKTLMPCFILSAAGCVGIAMAGGLTAFGGEGNYTLYAISMFVVRCTCMIFQMGGFMLCANWFIRYRGRVMGIITVGSPLFSVIGTSVMTTFIQNNLGGDYRPFYIGIAVVIIAMALVTWFGLKDTPEEAGLYPDGADQPPKSETEIEEVQLTVGQVLSSVKGWKLIIAFGAFTFIINACMGSMAARYMSLGMDESGPYVWFAALKWLSVGAILGIPMSYIFGWLDDKLGSVKTSIILGLCELLPVLGLMLQPEGGSVPLMVMWGFGVACMTGGVPTMHPCITAYCYGRREYQSANRIIMAIQLIPSAFAGQMMAGFIESGHANTGYIILLVVIAVGIVATASMLNMKDVNAADRDYGEKAA